MGRRKTTDSDAAATRNRIIEAAEKLFREVGYVKTTVADIAKVLGMSPANVYRYFRSKTDINEVICDRLVHNIESQCWESLVKDGTSTERLTRFIFEYHRVIKSKIIKEKRLYDMISSAMDEHWPVIQRHTERICELLKIIIEQGVSSHEFRKVDSVKIAVTIYEALAVFIYPSLIERWINDAEVGGQQGTIEDELGRLLDILLHGLFINTK